MVEAFKQWRVYLEGAAHPICVFSNHKNLEYFSFARTTSRRHARWAATLAAYQYTITYHKGASHGKPDALSRRPDYLPPPLPPSPFPSLQVQTLFFIPLPCVARQCWCLLLTPSSPTSRRPSWGIRSSLHS